ncbi:interaptin-like [Daphnia carinata]|uniref:interaptin-like n=1 Tax=Daphnia carinata TaxID=120202 RepID=UPI00257C1F08|nr:interaptin-like [Daphnia carinata]
MEESTDASEKSISMGPANLISQEEPSNEPVHSTISDASFVSPTRNQLSHAMGSLSISSITNADSSQIAHLHAAFSPDADFRPDILMSTVNSRQTSTSQEDLNISMGPLPGFDFTRESQSEEDQDDHKQPLTSLVANIEKLEVRQKKHCEVQQPVPPVTRGSKSIQTEELQCHKCEQLHILYNQKLLEVANEFQQQYTSQFQMVEQHVAASEDAQKQIKDLVDQLDAADKQLKANRAFLEQQAVEREQEREEASEQQKKLEALLTEKEKECERMKTSILQLTNEVQQLHETRKEKDRILQDHLSMQQRLEQQNQLLRINQADMDEENSSLQTVLDVKEKLLKAQSEQIAALQNELENHLYAHSETERESEAPASVKHDSTLQDVVETSLAASRAEMPSLFDELQQMICRLLHKVENSTRALEAAQTAKRKRTNNNLLSPRTQITPSTSTEDISIKDKNPRGLDDLRDLSSPSPTGENGTNNPERALNFLQQLDGKLAILSRIEEAACKRIADLEAELHRVCQSEKRSVSRAAELEQQYQQHRLLLQDVDAEKHELQVEHTELLKRISSLENRLEEQRRSAALGASQNMHAEKCRTLSEEKQQLQLIVQEKDESLASMQKQMGDLHQRIDKLMKAIQEKEQESTRRTQDDYSQSSVERLRDAPHQDGSMTWSKLGPQNSPVPLSPIYQPHNQYHQTAQLKHQETAHALSMEVAELKDKLIKCEKERQVLEDEAASNASRLAQLESLELRNAALDDMVDEAERQKKEYEQRCTGLEKELEECRGKLQDLATVRERGVALEKELSQYKAMAQEVETSCQLHLTLKKEYEEHKQASQATIDELQKQRQELETTLINQKNLAQEYDIMRRRCIALETEAAAQRGTITAVEVLQQRCASLQSDLIYQQQTAQQQCSALKAQLDSKEKRLNDLQTKLKQSDSCKAQVEEALQKLQLEVEAVKKAQQLQQKQKSAATADPRELSTLLEGPPAPPDLLAPSFVEFLGSATSSRCSSRAASIRIGSPAYRTAESSTLNDLSLPNSMVGKTALKEVQRESEQLLAFGKHMLEMQQNAAQQKANCLPSTNQNIEDDLETTLMPDGDSFVAGVNPAEVELTRKMQLLRTELAMERLLLQDQRTANSRLQQQVMQLIAQQRNQPVKSQPSQKSISAYRSLPPEQATKFLQYRALKLESIRKNLIYQKKFLSTIANEWDQNHNQRTEKAFEPKKALRCFRVAVFTVISIQRMRYVVRLWRQRRRAIEAQPSSD